jgi:hypothetical protein
LWLYKRFVPWVRRAGESDEVSVGAYLNGRCGSPGEG